MTRQNRFAEAIVAANATQSTLFAATTFALAVGELAYTTDTKRLYIAVSTGQADFIRVHGLDMAVVSDGNIVTSSGEIVWQS